MSQIERLLERAKGSGFLGSGPIEVHIRHAKGFLVALGQRRFDTLLDLGAGGGVPGLLLAAMMPEVRVLLLDASQRRTAFLGDAVHSLGFGERVTVLRERAERAGRLPELRETMDVVVARSFGCPATTAECGSPLVVVGGTMVVSEPPAVAGPVPRRSATVRWPPAELELLDLVPAAPVVGEGFSFQILEKTGKIGDRYPRRSGLPGQRPLF
ncbi:MAG: class I SAM-dependent methyltransferase [Actinomycetota bacterium]|nr:class I SAM-dependent methyltransferase [Actinomycetota bacterium]